MRVTDIPEIEKLSVPEKILLVEDIWETITGDESEVPVPETHRRALDRRFKRYKSQPGRLLSFEELREKIELRK